MAIITISDLELSFGHPPLVSGGNALVETGDRVVLLGRNGSGKSTLLTCLAGIQKPTRGLISLAPGFTTGYLPQAVPLGLCGRSYDVVAGALAGKARILQEFHEAATALERGGLPNSARRFDDAQRAVEESGAWELHETIMQTLQDLNLDPDADFTKLSGGGQRRVLLARALVGRPDLLLLDEPTNHLDILAIEWLETVMRRYPGTIVFVTHDRALVRKVATRILEIDLGQITTWNMPYDSFLEKKREYLESLEIQQQAFDRKLAQEEEWASGGIKARRTRNEGRKRALEQMRQQRAERRKQFGQVSLKIQAAQRSGDMIIETDAVSFGWGENPLVQFETRITKGDRIGILGPNGSGKTTLLRLLLGDLKPQTGSIRLGTNVLPVYFDQLRDSLDPEQTVVDAVGDGRDIITFDGRPLHIYAYLDRFLFSRDRARVRIKDLSGGEKARLVLANLLRAPCNLLVMDEPTNDLDVDTLELLEQTLVEFKGTILVVSHDREFLNNVVTSTLVIEADGRAVEYGGGYDDWLAQRQETTAAADRPERTREPRAKTSGVANASRKLTLGEQTELASMEQKIAQLEQSLVSIDDRLADPEVYRGNPSPSIALLQQKQALTQELDQAFSRWAELEAVREAYEKSR